MIQKIRKCIDNEKGDVFQFIIILAIVAIIAVATLPRLNSKIGDTADGAIGRIGDMETEIGVEE